MTASTIREDYDEYTLHNVPSESTQCDLGAIANPSIESDAILEFDDAGFVRPVWETGSSSDLVEEEDWTLNSHNDNHNHEQLVHAASTDSSMEEPLEDEDI